MELKKGLISVIMSNYNTPEEYLREAIESILNQTYSDFEFIIVDDCSTDNSLDIIESYNDPRIVLIKNEENMGLTKSINRAIQAAKGEFLARMDADDISLPERFQKQINYMAEHPSLLVCGTWGELFGSGSGKYANKLIEKTVPEKDTFQINLLFGNQDGLLNNVVMFRHQMLLDKKIKYNEKYPCAQDFRMWVDCSRAGECRNIPEILVKYRIHDKAISSDKKDLQDECAKNIMAEQLAWLGLDLPEDWENLHWGLLTGRKPYDLRYRKWIKTIIKANKKHKVFNHKKLKNILWSKWTETVYFEFVKTKKLSVILSLPLFCYPKLFEIKKARSSKEVN